MEKEEGRKEVSEPKVMFRVVTTGAPRLSSVKLVRTLDRIFPEWDIDFFKIKATYIQFGWANAIIEAKKKNPDFLILMCDDLSIEDPGLLGRLPKHDVPVVDAMVPNWQNGSFYWNCYHLTKDGILFSDHPYGKTGLTQVYSTAMGCPCIRKDVLERFGSDLFFVPDMDGNGMPKFMGGNDSYICRQFHKKNIPIYVDNEIQFDQSAVISMKATMDLERKWTQHCLDSRNRMNIIQYGSFLPSRICVNTKSVVGVDLPVCESYKLTPMWSSDPTKISPAYSAGKDDAHIPKNG